MKHRHLDYPAGTAPEDLPSAAIVDILDRGDLQDWLPLARAVAAQPNGALADRIAALVDAFPMYGTSPLWRAWIDRRRLSVAPASRDPLTLPELRRRRGLSQADVALRLGISQSDVSKLERRRDLKLSTMRDYLAALDCPLHLTTRVDGADIDIDIDISPPH